MLAVRVDLDAPQAQFLNPVHLILNILHGRMDSAEGHKAVMGFHLAPDEIVDGLHMLRLHRHRQNQIIGNAGQSAPLHQHPGGAVHFFSDVIIISDALGCLPGNGIGIHMGMDIDKFHSLYASIPQDILIIIPVRQIAIFFCRKPTPYNYEQIVTLFPQP